MTVRPCTDASPAQWLLTADRDWSDLAVRGPLGFEAYARLRFIPDPTHSSQRAQESDTSRHFLAEITQLSIGVSHLANHTTTPDNCYFAIWEGWGGLELVGPVQVPFINREAVLFNGTADDLSTWVDSRDHTSPDNLPIPAFLWPADQAWCIANDVDSHFATIGASSNAIGELLDNTIIDVTEDDPSRPQPWYID
ncbi:hypothetical protein E5720_09580 [Rhodococcus sp. PAMC28707]|uniref:hypothetical protein n=1 Tax=unclassified Rhodococcus (in: high G+C Gram-positive bacteria) TaxID=192944 RepID=UPI00109E31DE|nr:MULTISPECIES: hypothetical protein [unclassified Rhodococcus (in: high G+C Gram-positive bacteria)]QCB49580.1 hypothetical protein E5769_04435 [Rhodococcus sp. PAMC28705]QCB58731.1 hypothetical protein E5720_09580 [Rhodococcus sp. PAMC28707]